MAPTSKPQASGLQAYPGLRAKKRVWVRVLSLHLPAPALAVYLGMPLTSLYLHSLLYKMRTPCSLQVMDGCKRSSTVSFAAENAKNNPLYVRQRASERVLGY